jgi:hypothetical protein
MSDEATEATKYLYAPGTDAWEAQRYQFVAMNHAQRVADLRTMDAWLDKDPRRTKSYAVFAKHKRELEAIHNDLLKIGR